MPIPSSQRVSVAQCYKPVYLSDRWKRLPILTGSSDDDRVGGGASLTAASDLDNSERAASSSHTSDKKKEPVAPYSNLRGDAKPFESKVLSVASAEASDGFTSAETSPTSVGSFDAKSTPIQSPVTMLVMPADGTQDYAEMEACAGDVMKPIANCVMPYAVKNQKPDTIHYDVNGRAFMPTAGMDIATANGKRGSNIPPRLNYQGHQPREFSNRHVGVADTPPAASPTYEDDYRHRHTYAAVHQPYKYQATSNRTLNIPTNGRPYQESNTQHESSARVTGYKYGLPGSSSDGTMSRFYTNGQSNTSLALVQFDNKSTKNQSTVGPMAFEAPTKATMDRRSEMLQALTEHGQPSLNDLLDPRFLPFMEAYKYAYPSEENGVIAIRNIPYETTRGEIIALLGKSSKILNDRQEPVHIIMDRVTSKTQDAYCELSSLNAAIELVDRFRKGAESGRPGRLGNRVVEVELSSQTNLMVTLFPTTKYGVKWVGTHPRILMGSDWPWENFKGFLTEEEMVMLAKHVENPQRSIYAQICPERPYECMISTLRKMPWHMADRITIKQRHSVYETTMKMIKTLVSKVEYGKLEHSDRRDNDGAERLTPQLLDRLVTSAMLCSGFSVVQKHNIATEAGLSEARSREFNQPRFPDSWRHQWTLVPKTGMPIDVLEWYISVIRAETNRVVQSLDISQRMPLQRAMEGLDGYWGFFWAEANFPLGKDWDNMSLAECSRLEWEAIERIVTRAIQGGSIPDSYESGSYHINPTPSNGPTRLGYKGC